MKHMPCAHVVLSCVHVWSCVCVCVLIILNKALSAHTLQHRGDSPSNFIYRKPNENTFRNICELHVT